MEQINQSKRREYDIRNMFNHFLKEIPKPNICSKILQIDFGLQLNN